MKKSEDDRDKIKAVFKKNGSIDLAIDLWQDGLEREAKARERTKRRLGFYAGQIHGLKEAMKIFMK